MNKGLIIRDATILTCDSQDCFIPCGDIYIKGKVIERIAKKNLETHETSFLAEEPEYEVISAAGRIVMPGLINAHTHLSHSLMRAASDDRELFSWLEDIRSYSEALTPLDRTYATWLGALESVRSGVTTVCNFGIGPEPSATVARKLGLRMVAGDLPATRMSEGSLKHPLQNPFEDIERALAEYKNEDGLMTLSLFGHSLYKTSPEALQEIKRQANRLEVTFNIHLAESLSEVEIIDQRYGCTPVQHARALGLLDARTLCNHCVWFKDEDITLFGESGASIVHCPVSNAKLACGIAPVKTYCEQGIRVGLGTDGAASNNSLNMFEEMKFAILIQRASTRNPLSLTAADVLMMATYDGARALNLSQKIGSVEVGKKADLLLVRPRMPFRLTHQNVLSHIVYSAGRDDVERVIIDGRTVVENGIILTIDEEALLKEIYAYYQYRRSLAS